jgi:hypothetical protein
MTRLLLRDATRHYLARGYILSGFTGGLYVLSFTS